MTLLNHLNLYFGFEAKTMKEFICDFKDDFEGDESGAMGDALGVAYRALKS